MSTWTAARKRAHSKAMRAAYAGKKAPAEEKKMRRSKARELTFSTPIALKLSSTVSLRGSFREVVEFLTKARVSK